MRNRVLNVLLIVALLFGTLPALWAPQPVAAADPPPDGARNSQSIQAEMPELTNDFAATALESQSSEVMYEIAGETGPAIYIIQLVDAPLASYRGGLQGLTATSPLITGDAKLDIHTTTSRAYLNYLTNKRVQFLTDAGQLLGRAIEVRHTYRYAYNGLAVTLTPEEAAKVVQMPGVRRVIRNFTRYVQTDTTPDFLNAWGIWDGTNTGVLTGTMGEGMVVGIIDTGINMDNRAFAATADDGYTHTNPRGQYYGWCDPSHPRYDSTLVCNDKLIGVYSYPSSGDNPEDDHSHGSHTGSTTAGNVLYNVDYEGYTFSQISGMAPRANIIAYDVCTATGGCQGDSIMAAIDDATADAVDVINYSIGGGPTDPWNDSDSDAYLNAREAGVFVATSAGNDGPNAGTVGSPGNAPWVMTVGNSTIGRVIANVFDVTGPGTVPAELTNIAAIHGPDGPAIAADIETDIIYAGDVDAANIEGCNAFPAGAFTASIAMIQRGTCNFAVKVNNATAAGAVAVVVFNNAGGPPIVMGGLEGTTIPAVFISLDEGIAVRNWIQAETDPTARISAELGRVVNADWADIMAVLSSRGPNVNADWIKPDVTAPGTNIFAAYMGGPEDFGMMSGTSMASPHVAGAATLIRSLYPTWTPAEVQSALMMTSWTENLFKEDATTPADPFDVGAGRLDLTHAALTGLVLHETYQNYTDTNPALGGDPTTLNLASLANQNCVGSCSWTRTFRSVLATDVTYNVTTSGVPAGMVITVEPATFTIAGGATQVLTVTVDADLDVLTPGAWAFAQLHIEEAVGITLLEESFEDATFPPTDWTLFEIGAVDDPGWEQSSVANNVAPRTGDHAAYHSDANTDGLSDAWMVTPRLTIPDDGAVLSFWQADFYQDYYNYHGVWVTTAANPDPSLITYTEVYSGDVTATWVEQVIDLSAYAGEEVYIAFRYQGDYEDEWYVDDVLVEVVEESSIPAHHLPIAVRPVAASSTLTLNPTALAATQPPDTTTADTLVIGNAGGLPLDWQFATSGSGMLWNQPRVGTSGRLNNYSNADNTGIYQSSAFDLFHDAAIETIFMEGFALGTTLANATGLNWYIYEDVAGSPAGNPEDGQNLHIWSYTAGITDPGVSITDDNMALDLVAAGVPPVTLSPGTYWLLAYPDLPAVTLGPNVLYAWFHSGTGIGQQIGPDGLLGWPTTWTSAPEGRAFSLAGQITCTVPSWLTLDPMSGLVDPESAQNVAVTFDSTGLAAGTYTNQVCLTTNDPANELVLIPATLNVEATAEIVIETTELNSVQWANTTTTNTLTISNTGIADLEWEIEEAPGLNHLIFADWAEGFDDITLLPGLGWAIINNSEPLGTASWFQGNPTVLPAHSGAENSYIGVNFNSTAGVGTISNWGLTPEITFNNGDTLRFWTRTSTGSSWADRLQVRMSTAGASIDVGTTATSVGDFTTLLEDINPTLIGNGYPQAWTEYVITISGLSGPTNGRIGFRYFVENGGPSGSNSNYIGIDTLTYASAAEPNPCDSPADLPWLSVDPASGITAPDSSDDTIVTFDSTGLGAGIYEGNLCVSSNDPATPLVVVPVNLEVQAVPTYTLTVNVVGNGSVDPMSGIYEAGEEIILTATADMGWEFMSWSGDLTGDTNPATLVMDANKVVTATFIEAGVPTYTLTVNVVGNGSVDPMSGIYAEGTEVILTASADMGWEFMGWSGDLTGDTNPATLVMDANKVVTATFIEAGVPTYTLTVNVVGNGSVDPMSGIYAEGTEVILTASADMGWEFMGWSGDLTGDTNPATLVMDANKVVTATFVEETFTIYLPLVARNYDATEWSTLTVLHTNDFHARVDEYNRNGARCKPADEAAGLCMAGVSRLATVVEELRTVKDNVLLLDAGDQFQGTLFFTVFGSSVLTDTMNTLGYDAMAVGNHEFDSGPAELARFIDGVNFPVLGTNIDASAEPLLNGKILPHTIIERGGEQIGIIGITTPETENISSPGDNITFTAPITAAQNAVDALTALGIDKIIALTHQGYDYDLELAEAVSGIDIIIGGHSHTFLYNPDDEPIKFGPPVFPQYDPLTPAGAYPTVVESPAEEPVLVVTAYQWGTFLGHLDVTFHLGTVAYYGGNPIFLGNDIAKSATLETLLDKYRPGVADLVATPVGTTTVALPINVGGQQICRLGECLMGNLVADAMLWAANQAEPGTNYQIAFQNGGGLRAPIMTGTVTMGDVLETLPFGNAIATFQLEGTYVKAALENGARTYPSANGGFAHVSGLRYTINADQPVGDRVSNIEVWNGTAWEALVLTQTYNVVTNDFMRKGGDNYLMFRDYAINPYDFGPNLADALADYLGEFSPVTPEIEGRIIIAYGR